MCRCGTRWGGTTACHCPVCHITFGGVTSFDAHKPGECLHPSTLGLAERNGVWRSPMPEELIAARQAA